MANDGDSFGDSIEDGLLTEDEVSFILTETRKIAERITKEAYTSNVEDIIKKYYEIE